MVSRKNDFGLGSVEYLTERWNCGDDFRSLLSETPDFSTAKPTPEEVFTPVLLGDLFFMPPRPPWLQGLLQSLQPLVDSGQPIHFFKRKELLPPDTDCTAVAFSLAARALRIQADALSRVATRIGSNICPDGIIQVYFDPGGKREGLVDHVVCVNALYLLNQAGQADCAVKTESYVLSALNTGSFLSGSRYYHSPETFLYFLTRLVTAFPERYQGWAPSLIARVRERQGLESRPLELAQRVLTATRLGVDAAIDAWLLQRRVQVNGSFPADALFRYGRSSRYFGGGAITTAFAARALLEYGRGLRIARTAPGRTFIGQLETWASGPATRSALD